MIYLSPTACVYKQIEFFCSLFCLVVVVLYYFGYFLFFFSKKSKCLYQVFWDKYDKIFSSYHKHDKFWIKKCMRLASVSILAQLQIVANLF